MVPYENALAANLQWALVEGSLHFEGRSQVHVSLRRLAEYLESIEFPYAVIGPMALFAHGYRRFTEVVDLLMFKSDIDKLHEQIDDNAYQPFGQNIRHRMNGVLIVLHDVERFQLRPPVSAASQVDPFKSSTRIDGVQYVNLAGVLNCLLVEGIASRRLSVAADVQDAIKHLALPLELEASIGEHAKSEYRRLWHSVRDASVLYAWRLQTECVLPIDVTWEDVASHCPELATRFDEMRTSGVTLVNDGSADTGCFLTSDLVVAGRFDFRLETDDPYEVAQFMKQRT